ncbi:UNVERIFIED_CONTAM: hypothetical protein GTU68_016572 [Idotea baltica]|nr:hypothetical protein [Idotea baltica]
MKYIAACEGALLLVDATQGIQAQTISNLYLALEQDLEIIPVINKIDMDGAMIEDVADQIIDLIGCERDSILEASGKTGIGIDEILESIVERVPAPSVFDSVYNQYRGVITYIRIFNGTLKKGQKIQFVNSGNTYFADEVGVLRMDLEPKSKLSAGDTGYIITGAKESKDVKVGDTVTLFENPTKESIHGFEDVKPMVFAGIYPIDNDDFEDLRESLNKLQLNDASLTFEPETSIALGFGFRCGFLGMLHLEIVQERLEREFDMTVITTVPQVSYYSYLTNGDKLLVNNPSDLPDPSTINYIEEPYIQAQIITKPDFIGAIMKLCLEKRGELKNQIYLSQTRVELIFEIPLAEIVFDFYDKLKSISKGYASFDYQMVGYKKGNLVKLDIKLNGENVDALSSLIHRDKAYYFGRKLVKKLRDLLNRQQFLIAIQAAIGAKIIARETLSALRKDVTAKCYGGDITRKRKLLEKQKKGKKKMRQIGTVEVPQQAFLAVLKLDD